MKELSRSQALKELKEEKFIGITLFDNTKAFIANSYGYTLLSNWEDSPKSNNFSAIAKSPKEVIENHGQAIKRVIIFSFAKGMFKWLSE